MTLSVNGATPKAINAYASSTCNVSSSKNVTCYQIDTGELAVGASASKPVRIWVNEDSTPESADGQKVSLSLFIKGEVNES